jgi:hypothetical protein
MASLWLITHDDEKKHIGVTVQTKKYADDAIGIEVLFQYVNSVVSVAKLQLDAQETVHLIAKLAGHLAEDRRVPFTRRCTAHLIAKLAGHLARIS